MASLTTDTSLTQQATALAKEFGLRLMTPASVTIDELEQISIDQLERVKALRERNKSTGETKVDVAVVSASTSQVVPSTPGDVATKHPNESYGEFYTRKGRGLTYDKATAGQLKKAKEKADNIAKALKEEQEGSIDVDQYWDTRADRAN